MYVLPVKSDPSQLKILWEAAKIMDIENGSLQEIELNKKEVRLILDSIIEISGKNVVIGVKAFLSDNIAVIILEILRVGETIFFACWDSLIPISAHLSFFEPIILNC